MLLCISLLATSLILPLSTAVGATIAFGLTALSLLSSGVRTRMLWLLSGLTPSLTLCLFALIIIVALSFTPKMSWFDTGVYHLGIIKWLSKYGAVPGITLINPKFGFTSSWFALAAPLTPEAIGSRIGAITNGFIVWMAIVQLLICWIKTLEKRSRISDWFLLSFFSISISLYALKFSTSPILVSFTADIAVTFLIGLTAWSILIISDDRQSSHKLSTAAVKSSILDARIIPLILSCGAVTLKLSAFPLLPVTFLYYIWGPKINIQRILGGVTTIFLLLLPMILFGVITSGCPLYPSTAMCLDTPWLITKQQAIEEASEVQFWWKLVDEDVSGVTFLLLGFLRWLQGSINSQMMIALLVASFVLSFWILRTAEHGNNRGYIWLIGIGFLGMSFIMIKGPLIRFGLGYFILVSSLSLAHYGLFQLTKMKLGVARLFSFVFRGGRPSKLIPLGFLLLLGFTTATVDSGDVQARLILPLELPIAPIEARQVNDVKYVYPLYPYYKACWGAKLPCAPEPIENNIKLRNPSQGLGAGFVQAK